MTIYHELVFLMFLLLLWLTCVFEAFCGLSGGRVRKIEEKDPDLAEKLDAWLEHDEAFRAQLKLMLFIAAAMLGAFALLALEDFALQRPELREIVRTWWWAVAIAVIAAAGIVCELTARFILYRWDIFFLRTAIPLISFLAHSLFLPFTWAVEKVARMTDDWTRTEGADDKASVEDEIMSYVESYNDDSENDLEEGEKQMIRGILEIGDMSVREIMTPRVDLTALPASATIDEAKKLFIESGHSRIPVYGRSIDEIRGILYAKDFLDETRTEGKTLLNLAHTPIFIPETKEVAELLEEIKRSRNHFAVIIDEFGGTSGIVTFEDIIEEIVGDVHDEYDTESDFKSQPQLQPDGSIVAEARTPISDINDIMDVRIPETGDADTIGGYICSELGRIPEVNTEIVVPGQIRATVLDADTRKIKTVRLELLEDEDDEGE